MCIQKYRKAVSVPASDSETPSFMSVSKGWWRLAAQLGSSGVASHGQLWRGESRAAPVWQALGSSGVASHGQRCHSIFVSLQTVYQHEDYPPTPCLFCLHTFFLQIFMVSLFKKAFPLLDVTVAILSPTQIYRDKIPSLSFLLTVKF